MLSVAVAYFYHFLVRVTIVRLNAIKILIARLIAIKIFNRSAAIKCMVKF